MIDWAGLRGRSFGFVAGFEGFHKGSSLAERLMISWTFVEALPHKAYQGSNELVLTDQRSYRSVKIEVRGSTEVKSLLGLPSRS